MRSVLTLAAAAALTLAPALRAQIGPPTMTLGEVIVTYLPEVAVGAEAFERHVSTEVVPAWTGVAGTELTLVRKDRGPHPGQYMLVWTTDTVARHRERAAPLGDAFPFRASVIAETGDFRPGLEPLVSGSGRYVEYHLVAPDVLDPLPAVDVLGLHYAQVRPDRIDEFDRFVAATLHPAVGNLRPDLRLLYYKPVRGEAPGRYLTVFALTTASRDKYWPNGADSDVLRAAFDEAITALTTPLRTYLVEDSYATGDLAAAVYESRDWADWVLLANSAR